MLLYRLGVHFWVVIWWTLPFACSMNVVEFASKACVNRALANPLSSTSVLSFFFGIDYSDPVEVDQRLRTGKCIKEMADLWYKGGPEYDKLCVPFADTIRGAGKGELTSWDGTVDGHVAQMILCDQLARNTFRGTAEAYAYDEKGLENSRILFQAVSSDEEKLPGEFFPPYLSFMVTAFMHSENVADHESALSLLKLVKARCPVDLLDYWNFQESSTHEHKDVVDRFGRYPHRNMFHGRESTPEELAWLEDRDNLPMWALSQLPATEQ